MALSATPEWKEQLIVKDEEGRTFTFDCGWGVTPSVAYVPSAADWRRCVPAWLADRRDEVIQAMERTGHVVHEDSYPKLSGE
jgi:hypothetical protein